MSYAQSARTTAKWLFALSVLLLVAGLFMYTQAFGATAGYPGPPGRPDIPSGPGIGPVNPGGTSGPTYVCGFQPGTPITFQVNGTTLVGTGRAESNGCIEFLVAVAGCPTVSVDSFSGSGPITLGPVDGLWGDNTVAATGLGVAWGPYHGQTIGLSDPFQIPGPTPECGGSSTTTSTPGPTTTAIQPTSTTKPHTTTTKAHTTTTRHFPPITRPTGPTTTTLAPFNPNTAPKTVKQWAAIAFLIGAAATAAGAAGSGGIAAAGSRARGTSGGGDDGPAAGSRTRGTSTGDDGPAAGSRTRGSGPENEGPQAGTKTRGTNSQGEDPQSGSRTRGNSGDEEGGSNSFTDAPPGGGDG